MSDVEPLDRAGAEAAQRLEQLRADRARYVAFSFCAFDVLIELDSDLRIAFSAGPTHLFLGLPVEQLQGQDWASLLAPDSASLVGEIRQAMGSHARVASRRTQLKSGRSVMLTGYALPNRPGVFNIGISLAPAAVAAALPTAQPARAIANEGPRDSASGLLTADALAKAAGAQAKDGPPLKMAMFDLGGLDEIDQRRAEKGEGSLLPMLGNLLSTQSVGGDAAARLADNRFGVLVEADQSEVDIAAQITELTRKADPSGKGAAVVSNTLDIDAEGFNQADVTRAVLYAVNRFASQADPGEFKGESMKEALNRMVKDALTRVSELRDVFTGNKMNLVFQPIVDLNTGQIRHQEALSRLSDGGSPFKLVTFAEEAGFVSEFDLGVVERVLRLLEEEPKAAKIGVNISGRSLQSNVFLAQMESLMRKHANVRKRMMVEITESSRIVNIEQVQNAIVHLKKQGHTVLLDDFGSGAAAFHYLRAFQVDVVKIDGSYVQAMEINARDRAFVRAICTLCKELGLMMVGEMIETEQQGALLKKMGVELGQGYLYGRPVPKAALMAPAAQTSSNFLGGGQRSGGSPRWE